MPFMHYLGKERIEVLCREIESSTGIKLKTIPCWLINKAQLEERLETGNKRRSAIIITVGNKADTFKLCAKELRFEGALKVVEKYWEVGPSSIYITYSSIRHDQLRGWNKKPTQWVIYARAHKSENHR